MYLERLVVDNIRRIRKEKGFSQEKLAEVCGTSTSYIGLLEMYRNIPKLATIERIALALGIDPLALFAKPDAPDAALLSEINLFKKKAERARLKERVMKAIEHEIDAILYDI